MDRDVLMHQMRERFEEEFAKALKALEDASDGHWIEASEMAFRDAALTVALRESGQWDAWWTRSAA